MAVRWAALGLALCVLLNASEGSLMMANRLKSLRNSKAGLPQPSIAFQDKENRRALFTYMLKQMGAHSRANKSKLSDGSKRNCFFSPVQCTLGG